MIRSVTGNNDFALPYWDWAANRTVPQAFRDATYNGQANPLYVATRNNGYSIPDTYTGPAVMADIFSQTNFELFGLVPPRRADNTQRPWIKAQASRARSRRRRTTTSTQSRRLHAQGQFAEGPDLPDAPRQYRPHLVALELPRRRATRPIRCGGTCRSPTITTIRTAAGRPTSPPTC